MAKCHLTSRYHSGIVIEGLGQSYKLENGGQGNNRGKREVSVEIMQKKLEGYAIKIYLYLIKYPQ